MSWIVTMVVGGIIGSLASILMTSNAQMGLLLDVVVGVIGSVLGYRIAGALGLVPAGGVLRFLIAVSGAALPIFLAPGRRILEVGPARLRPGAEIRVSPGTDARREGSMPLSMRAVGLLALAMLSACEGGTRPPVLGDANQPAAGSVLGTQIRTGDAEELRYYVLRKLTDRYAADKGIEVTPAEIEAYVRYLREAMKNDPNLPSAAEDSAEDRAARREIAGAFILQWKLNKALYEQYGGRIIVQQGGPEPLDAYRKFLEESQARGDFTIASGALESEFWRYYRDDSIHSFMPPGSLEERRAFAAPPWGS